MPGLQLIQQLYASISLFPYRFFAQFFLSEQGIPAYHDKYSKNNCQIQSIDNSIFAN